MKSATKNPEAQQVFCLHPLKFPHSRQSLSIKDVVEALGCNAQHVRNLIDGGYLVALPINPGSERAHLRIIRSSDEAFWLECYFQKNGTEYPCATSEEISMWRAELRKQRNGQPSFIQPAPPQ